MISCKSGTTHKAVSLNSMNMIINLAASERPSCGYSGINYSVINWCWWVTSSTYKGTCRVVTQVEG